ncbi:MAG: ABC transporter ATP-binding protein [Firmicutes bacterium]|nr:ABC transporter ATP-binding protein [Bacillota bacterium]
MTLAYGPRVVLAGVDLRVRPGEFAGLIGPNASGKSTLIKAVSRVLRPASGRVLLDGRDVWREMTLAEVARSVAVVPQDFPLDFPFTVEETVLMGRLPYVHRLRGEQPADLARAREAMVATGTLRLADRTLAELAGGERQRVVLAKALAQEPRLLLLDEPTSHLDLGHQVEILDLVLRLNREAGLTVLAVLHDLNLAAMYCRRLFLLGGGGLLAEGSPEEVLTPDLLRAAFGGRVLVGRHPVHGCPQVTQVSPGLEGPHRRAGEDGGPSPATGPVFAAPRVHVLAGGGTCGRLLEVFAEAGFRVSVGPLNAGDADWRTGRALGLEVVTDWPFSPLGRRSTRRAAGLMREADAVVVGPVPFGRGNLAALEAVAAAARAGRPVALVGGGPDPAGRDFTGGRAAALIRELEAGGSPTLRGPAEAVAWIRSLTSGGDAP